MLQGAQLIAVASSDPAAAGVDGSPLQGSDIQVQYVQLAPVTDHTAAAQVGPAPCAGGQTPCLRTGPGASAALDIAGVFLLLMPSCEQGTCHGRHVLWTQALLRDSVFSKCLQR